MTSCLTVQFCVLICRTRELRESCSKLVNYGIRVSWELGSRIGSALMSGCSRIIGAEVEK